MERDHADRMKVVLQGWLDRARREASKVSVADYSMPMDELDKTRTDYFELDKFAQAPDGRRWTAILKRVG